MWPRLRLGTFGPDAGAIAARVPVCRSDRRARRCALPEVVVQYGNLLPDRLVALGAAAGFVDGAAIGEAVVDPCREIDEVLHHAEVTPRPIRRAGQRAQ